MSVRVAGSWTSRNGRRRYVSTGLGTYALASLAACSARGIWGLMALPFVITWWALVLEAWACAELVLLTVTGRQAAAAVTGHRARANDITMRRARWGLWAVALKGRQG